MKRCWRCETTKPCDEFSLNRSASDGHESTCRDCKREINHEYYARNKQKWLDGRPRTKELREVRRNERRQLVWEYLNEHPCVDCGEPDPLVLDFDHVRGMKEQDICKMIRNARPVDVLLNEMNKCEVRCANCHRRRTATTSKWWRATQKGGAR